VIVTVSGAPGRRWELKRATTSSLGRHRGLASTLPSGGGGGQDARGADRVGLCVVSLLAAAHAEIDVRLMDIRQLDLSGSFYDLAAGGFVIHLVGQACAVSAWWRRAARRPSGHRLVGWVSAISATKVSGVRG
jgi:hypothetical protein